jgi:hypothetical protein
MKSGSGLVNHSECGVERWAVKTLTDAKASLVKRAPKTSSVAGLARVPAPVAVRQRSRIAGVETTVYRLRVALVEMKLEADDDVHLVVAGPATGQTMIVEFPSGGCTRGAPLWARPKMVAAKKALLKCGSVTRSTFYSPDRKGNDHRGRLL